MKRDAWNAAARADSSCEDGAEERAEVVRFANSEQINRSEVECKQEILKKAKVEEVKGTAGPLRFN